MSQRNLLLKLKQKLNLNSKGKLKLSPFELKQTQDAITFIESNESEFSTSSYSEFFENELTRKNATVSMSDLSIILDNLDFVKNQKHRNLIKDYYLNELDVGTLTNIYGYSSDNATNVMINKIVSKIRSDFFKRLDSELREGKYMPTNGTNYTNLLKKHSLVKVKIKTGKQNKTCHLVKVSKRKILTYPSKLRVEDYISLISKAKLVFHLLDQNHQMHVFTLLKNLIDSGFMDLKIEVINEIASYRWVDSKGNLLCHEIDTLITENKLNRFELENIQLF